MVALTLAALVALRSQSDVEAQSAAVRGEDVEQAQAASLKDYPHTVANALRKNRAALHIVFGLATRPVFDGAGAEAYNARLGHLLSVWGDHDFATMLSKESQTVREAVIRELDEHAVAEQMRRFPETSALAKHANFETK